MRTAVSTAVVTTALTVALLIFAACSATKEGSYKDIKFSGFLGDYSDLKRGGPGQVDYLYVEPGLNLANYTQIMLDPPQAWVSAEQRQKISEKNLTYLLTALDKAMSDALGAKWELVSRPGPHVLRVRMAITNADSAIGVLTPFTRLVPWGLVASEGVDVVTGDYINNGSVTGEEEVLDGATGRRLEAAVDRRVGGNSPKNVFSNWGDVVDACRYWSDRLTSRLVSWGMKPTK
jgi:hypothetical protein